MLLLVWTSDQFTLNFRVPYLFSLAETLLEIWRRKENISGFILLGNYIFQNHSGVQHQTTFIYISFCRFGSKLSRFGSHCSVCFPIQLYTIIAQWVLVLQKFISCISIIWCIVSNKTYTQVLPLFSGEWIAQAPVLFWVEGVRFEKLFCAFRLSHICDP